MTKILQLWHYFHATWHILTNIRTNHWTKTYIWTHSRPMLVWGQRYFPPALGSRSGTHQVLFQWLKLKGWSQRVNLENYPYCWWEDHSSKASWSVLFSFFWRYTKLGMESQVLVCSKWWIISFLKENRDEQLQMYRGGASGKKSRTIRNPGPSRRARAVTSQIHFDRW